MDFEARKVVLEHTRHIENRAWSTLNNYLVANSFILVAWATLYNEGSSADSCEIGPVNWIMFSLTILGFVSGIQWALVGARNWRYVRELVSVLRSPSGDVDGRALSKTLGGLEDRVHALNADVLMLSKQVLVLSGTPVLLACVYVVAAWVSVQGGVNLTAGDLVWVFGILGIGYSIFGSVRYSGGAPKP